MSIRGQRRANPTLDRKKSAYFKARTATSGRNSIDSLLLLAVQRVRVAASLRSPSSSLFVKLNPLANSLLESSSQFPLKGSAIQYTGENHLFLYLRRRERSHRFQSPSAAMWSRLIPRSHEEISFHPKPSQKLSLRKRRTPQRARPNHAS